MSDSMDKLAKGIRNAIDEKNDRKPKAYDTQAEVLSKEGDILWVHIPGGVDRTPVRRTVDANEGDSVMVRVADGRAWTLGNATNPPTDDSYARRGLRDLKKATQGAVDFVGDLSDQDITVNSIRAATGYIDDLYSKNITTENIKATTGYIQDLTAENITTENIKASTGYIHDLTAENITTEKIKAATGYIDDLTAKHITVNDLETDHATIGSLDATYAKVSELNAAKGRIDTLESNEVVVNDTLKAANANIDYLKSDYISTDRLVLTGNNQNNYPPVQITEAEFNVNKTAYWTKEGNNFVQCTEQSVYDEDTQYYVRQTVKSIIEAINTANTSDPQVVVSNDKLIAASMDVAELSAITADMGTLTAGKIEKGNNFINLNTSPATMEFKNRDSWDNSSEGIQFDAQGHLNIKGTINVVGSESNVPTTDELNDAINNVQIGGRNLLRDSQIDNGVALNIPSGAVLSYGGWTKEGALSISYNSSGDYLELTSTNSSSPNSKFGMYQEVVIQPNTDYILSAEDTGFCFIGYQFTGTTDIPLWPADTFGWSTMNGRMYKKIRTNESSHNRCRIYVYTSYASGTTKFQRIKLEKGNKVTDWSPAPEDLMGMHAIHTVDCTSPDDSYTYSQIIDYMSRTTALSWHVTSTAGIKIGDTVRMGITASDMGTNGTKVYLVATVTNVVEATRLYAISKGLDTTVIDGGHILTGSIDSNRMSSNVIKAVNDSGSGKIDANKINVGDIDIGSLGGTIGGRNLVTNSSNLADFLAESPANCTLTVVADRISIKHIANSTSTLGAYYEIPSPEIGAKYTLSFTVESAAGTGMYSVGGAGTSSVWAGIVAYNSVKKGRNIVTFTVPSGATSLRIYFSTNAYNQELLVSKVQLEKGSVASDWSPSPADLLDKTYINVKNIKIESSTYVSVSVSGEKITFTRLGDSTGNWGAYYDIPCDPNTYYTASAKVEAGENWVIRFGTATAVQDNVSIWSGLGAHANGAGVGGYYISSSTVPTYSNEPYIRIYFCSNVPGATWTISDISVQKGSEFANATSYITHVNNNGVTIHPYSGTSNRVSIDGNGVYVYKGNSLRATYGDTVTLQSSNGTYPKMTVSSTEAYFQYNSDSWATMNSSGFVIHKDGADVGYFKGETARIGRGDRGRVDIASTGIDLYGYNASASTPNSNLCHIGFASGTASSGTAIAPYYTFGTRSGNIGNYSTVEGYSCVASGYASHAEGYGTKATGGGGAHAEGSIIYIGSTSSGNAHITTASGIASHAEGSGTTASGDEAHSEGWVTTASGSYSHAEGYTTTASGIAAHAEGFGTTASGNYSHASGGNTIAAGEFQTAIGKYNVSDDSSLFIVGNGTASTRSNAFKMARNGDITSSGSITLGGSVYIPNNSWLYGKKADGSTYLPLCAINSSNQMFFGYGSYNSSVGASYFDGNTVNIRSNGAVNITGIVYPSSNIRLKNNTGLQGANTSGAYKSLIYISGSNTVNLGSSDCAVYVNGTSFSGSKSYTGSDLRLKHDIVPLDDRASELIMSLKPFEYKWNEEQEYFYSKGKCFGLGAQEVSKLMEDIGYNPEDYRVVEETPDGYLAICYTELIPHLIYVAQKQQKEIEELKGVIKCIS